MTYNTFDRFQGIWLGSIIGHLVYSSSSNTIELSPDATLLNWLGLRKQVAKLLEAERSLENIAPKLVLLEETIVDASANPTVITSEGRLDKLFVYGSRVLSLLPLIIFYGDDLNSFQIISKCYLKLAGSIKAEEITEEILIWSYLITLLLNNRSTPDRINFKLIREKVVNNAKSSDISSIKKLVIALEAVREGTSLHQLVEKLSKSGNSWQMAIAISFYCFATTPDDFRLSVKRAANLDLPMASWIATLTGTLSGAYNGIRGVPYQWRTIAEENLTYYEESQLASKLFKTWLGTYSVNNHQQSYNRELCAVATPRIIQPRPTLKIISQKDLYN